MNELQNQINFLVYSTPQEDVKVNAVLKDDTIWLTQKAMAELFGCTADNISLHLKNIYAEGELLKDATAEEISVVQLEGNRNVKRKQEFYNLDAIISVGYRVNSVKATNFRIWATQVLKEYMQKGFALDDERLKQGKAIFGKDYFKELLERVRSIRASERRIYQQITDIFAECSIDYNKDSKITHDFYATVQNKFHYAITKQTAADAYVPQGTNFNNFQLRKRRACPTYIIYDKADRNKENMGLTTWKNSPDGRILKSDAQAAKAATSIISTHANGRLVPTYVTVAKNYLSEKEIRQLERAVSGYFDYIEDLIERENTFTMEQFASSVNEFLAFRKYDVLPDNAKGKISKKAADEKAETEYEAFNKTQKIVSDFDKVVKSLAEKSRTGKVD